MNRSANVGGFVFALMILTMACGTIDAQEADRADYRLIIGPRIGVSWILTSAKEFTSKLNSRGYHGAYVPIMTVFGGAAEQQVLLGETASHFALQEVILVSGLEQSLFLPSGSVLMGYRDLSGAEFGLGPTASASGIGVVLAAGWTITYRGVYIPVDLSLVLPNKQRAATLALTTGFNFIIRSTYAN